MGERLLVHLREFLVRDLMCVIPVRLVPNSSRHLSRKKVCLVVIVCRCLRLVVRV